MKNVWFDAFRQHRQSQQNPKYCKKYVVGAAATKCIESAECKSIKSTRDEEC